VNRVQEAEPPGRSQRLAAAPATVADEAHPALNVLAELDEPKVVSLLEQVQHLADPRRAGDPVLDE
jgi:hypothetical protein